MRGPTLPGHDRALSGLVFARRDRADDPTAAGSADDLAHPAAAARGQVIDLENGPIDAVWTYFRMTAASAAREKLILHYGSIVSHVAARVATRLPNNIEQADLVSWGMFGLIDAIDKFEPDRDVRFETYAQTRIRGAIIDGLRSMDWVPRSVRSKARSVERAISDLESALLREPTRQEIADHLGIAAAELSAIESNNSTTSVVALDELLAVGDAIEQRLAPNEPALHNDDPARSIENAEQREILFQMVGTLGNRDRLVLMLYYFERMTLSDIGRVLGVTESRISQLHSNAMKQLRIRVTEYGLR
ncbi:FliA/WhiG family RNA polymerase sigma factor [Rarobacter incanus]|nr:FliA/WhiG family RNA polymerase sigma factor [Rarobacter incanus]